MKGQKNAEGCESGAPGQVAVMQLEVEGGVLRPDDVVDDTQLTNTGKQYAGQIKSLAKPGASEMTTLTQADLEHFAKLSFPAELLDLAGVVRVSDSEARGTYGIKGSGDMAGIAFQYFDPESMSNVRRRIYVRIRRDRPELEDGNLKKKYVAPYGDRKRLYFPPTPELFAEVTVPIVLVEAEKFVSADSVGGADRAEVPSHWDGRVLRLARKDRHQGDSDWRESAGDGCNS